MPFDLTSASGKGRILGMGEWGDDDLIPDVERPTPAASLVVNDWLWGDGRRTATVIPWTWLQTPLDLRTDQPINSVTVTRTSGAAAASNNTTSQNVYGTFSASGSIDTASPDDAGNLGTFLTTYYANPLLRSPVLSFNLVPRVAEERWRILSREIGDRITLGPGTFQDFPGHTTVIPVPATLPAAAQTLVIEGIHHTSSVDGLTVEWTTSPVLAPTRSYLSVPNGSYASTPETSSLDVTGDIDLRADIAPNSWFPGAFQVAVGKYITAGNQKSFYLGILSTGLLVIGWSPDGSTEPTMQSTIPPPAGDGRLAIRATLSVNNGAGGHTATFYTADTIVGTWQQLGAPVTVAGTTSIFASTSPLSVGAVDNGATAPYTGRIYAAEVHAGINGPAVAVGDFTSLAAGTTSFTDTTGHLWTLAGSSSVNAAPGGWFRLNYSTMDGPDAVPF